MLKNLEQDSEEQIPNNAAQLKDWTYPRGDLFHWVGVLNRFDNILQRICDEYDLQHIQSRDFDAVTKDLLLAITNFSTTLFENCTNRNIYNSYEVIAFSYTYIYIIIIIKNVTNKNNYNDNI